MSVPISEKKRLLKRHRAHVPRKVTKSSFVDPPQDLASLVRGMYGRVARNLHLDPSYVSRVARGERQSELVDASLRRELNKIVRHAIKQHDGTARTSGRVKARKG